MATFTPAPTPLSDAELAGIRCALRSGIEPTLEQGRRLLATIGGLQKALVLQTGRMADLAAVEVEEKR
jgi:hypothetical protein